MSKTREKSVGVRPLGNPTYRAEIDGLRALAVIPVILYHAGIDEFSGGYVGVDVFFVISGFLITSILIFDLQAGQFSLKSFYERRSRRILPALFAVMLATIPFAWMWLPAEEMQDFAQSLVATTVFGSNILFYRESGYFDSASELKPLLHTWSLGVEEQFYLIFPILLMVIWRFGRRSLGAIIFVLAFASLLASQWSVEADPAAGFYLLPTRFWELALGALAAIFCSKFGRAPGGRVVAEVAGWLGLALIAWAVFAFDKATPFPGIFALVPTAGALLIVLFAREGTSIARVLGSKLLVSIGLLSYSAYLWHNPIFAFSKRFLPLEKTFSTTLLLIGLTAVLSFLSWKFIETPFRNRKVTPLRSSMFAATVVAASLLSFGLWGHFTGGFKIAADSPLDVPRTSVISGQSYLVLGDSHAEHLIYGLGQLTTGDVVDLTSAGCIPLRDVDRYDARFKKGDCASTMNSHLDSVLAQDPDAFVILSSMGPVYLDGTPFNGFDESRVTGLGVELITDPSITDRWLVYETGLRTTFDELSTLHNAKIIFFIDVPELGDSIGCRGSQKGIGLGIFTMRDFVPGISIDSCRISREAYDGRASRYKDLIYSVAMDYPRVNVFDPTDIFCDKFFCRGIDSEGRALYRDGDHLSKAGSQHVAEELVLRAETN